MPANIEKSFLISLFDLLYNYFHKRLSVKYHINNNLFLTSALLIVIADVKKGNALRINAHAAHRF